MSAAYGYDTYQPNEWFDVEDILPRQPAILVDREKNIKQETFTGRPHIRYPDVGAGNDRLLWIALFLCVCIIVHLKSQLSAMQNMLFMYSYQMHRPTPVSGPLP